MRYCALSLLMLAVVAISPDDAWAQRGQGRGGFGGGRGPGGSSLSLLSQKSVQDELKLTDDQVKKAEEQIEKQRGAFAGLRELAREERQKKMEERAQANDAALAEILKPDQLKRFKQIELQQRGAQAVADPAVAQALSLTTEQKDRVGAIQEASGESLRELFQAAGGDREEMRTKAEELRKSTNEKIQAVLTPEQQAKWKELTGEPFKGEIIRQRGGNRTGAAARLRGRIARIAQRV